MLSIILINLTGLVLIFFIVKWFWLQTKKKFVSGKHVKIVVKDGVYNPANIKAKLGETITLEFVREDATPCSEMVIFPQLEISETLPLHQKKKITITPTKIGNFDFACQMGMYRGILSVE